MKVVSDDAGIVCASVLTVSSSFAAIFSQHVQPDYVLRPEDSDIRIPKASFTPVPVARALPILIFRRKRGIYDQVRTQRCPLAVHKFLNIDVMGFT